MADNGSFLLCTIRDRQRTKRIALHARPLTTLQEIVGVSILRSGGPFSDGLRRVIRDVPLGALLIQSDPHTGEPLLLNTTLPEVLRSPATAAKAHVFLLDSQMGTGAAARECGFVFLVLPVLQPCAFSPFLNSRVPLHAPLEAVIPLLLVPKSAIAVPQPPTHPRTLRSSYFDSLSWACTAILEQGC